MPRLVFVESSCLVDSWSMAKEFVLHAVRELGGADRADAVHVLEAEAARGTDLRAVHNALWGLLCGYDYGTLSAPAAATGCMARTDPLGRAASHAVRGHLGAGDTVVVVSELFPVLVPRLAVHLGVDRVLCGAAPVDARGRLTWGFPDILLGASAGAAAESEARQASVPLAHCVAYGRAPRDRELLGAVGHSVRIGYDGELYPSSRRPIGTPAADVPASATVLVPRTHERPTARPVSRPAAS